MVDITETRHHRVRVFREPLFVIDYRCPSYLTSEAHSFLREHAIFCSLAVLSRATLPQHPLSLVHGARESSRNPQVQIVCIVRISDDISHYIKLWRVRSKGSTTWIATLSPLATGQGDGRFLSQRRPTFFLLPPAVTRLISMLPWSKPRRVLRFVRRPPFVGDGTYVFAITASFGKTNHDVGFFDQEIMWFERRGFWYLLRYV